MDASQTTYIKIKHKFIANQNKRNSMVEEGQGNHIPEIRLADLNQSDSRDEVQPITALKNAKR